jgi:hypothetical protein
MGDSCPLPSGRDSTAKPVDWKTFAEELRRQWRVLWRERIDDKVRAEGIADKDFELLFVEQGTVIVATRRYKQLEFKEILEEYNAPYETKVKQEVPDPQVGGWRKFGREIAARRGRRDRLRSDWFTDEAKGSTGNLQRKKGGRGWLHFRTR